MHILVLMKMAPDVVEELEIAPGGTALDLDCARMIPNESDEHALEEALLLKERHGAKVTVLAIDAPELDDALFTALAKGADRAVKIAGIEAGLSCNQAARALARVIARTPGLLPADLVMTGVQAIDDLDALTAPVVAHELDLPYLGIVTRIAVNPAGGSLTAVREYPGGVRGEFEVALPACLGIQAAEKPPRYVPVAKVRIAMKSQAIDRAPAPAGEEYGWPQVRVVEMKRNEPAGHAEMLQGTAEQAAEQVAEIMAAHGLF